MIFQFGQYMADKEKERGRLFSIQIDGSDSVPFIIKKDKLLIGRGDSCEIRIYVDGVAHEHCIITFNEEGRGFVEPVNKCGFTFLNGDLIERQLSLEHNDVIKVVKRSFRFHYPTSSKFYVARGGAASFEDNMVRVLTDFEVEDAFSTKGKDNLEKRVTFGPRLSPEEFDKSMPPASPLRKGSLPRDKLKAKTRSFEQEVIKSQIKKNLFMNKAMKANAKSTPEMPESTVVLRRLNCTPGSMKKVVQEEISKPSRPLFSEIVKKSVPTKTIIQNVSQKCSSQKFLKRTKLRDSKKALYKSPKRPVNPRLLAVGSTGHANSPETIIISKRRFNPNSSRNSVPSSKRRKSLRVLQEDVTEASSESAGDIHENNSLLGGKTRIRTSVPEKRKSSAMKRKVNDENKAATPAENRSQDSPYRKRNVSSTSSEGKAENYAPARKSTGTPARKSISAPARKSVGTPTRRSIGTPARKSVGTPTRRSIGTPARKSIGTSARKSTSAMIIEDEIPNELDEIEELHENEPEELLEDEPEEINEDESEEHEDEFETEVLAEEVDENEIPSNSTSLVAAINNVAQIDENNLDKSLKDIHNIVQALSCHSNVPTLGSDRLTADMCTNAVKKLALTISMINAFHMYNRIIDDVSSFPLCFPSTSFEPNSDSLRHLRSGHQNEDSVRMSRFQDIMQTFFSNSASSQRRRLLRSCEDGLSPNTASALSNKRSRRSLNAIDSGHKTPTRKSSDSQVSFVSNDVDESNDSGQSSSDYEDISAASSSSLSKSPRTPMSNKEKSANTSRTSVSLGKDNSFHSPSLNAISSDELSFPSDLDLRKSKATRTSSTSAGRQSTGKSLESHLDSTNASPEKRKSLEHKKSPIFKRKTVKISPKKMGSVLTVYSKTLRNRAAILGKPRTPKVVAKKFRMTKSKKLKAQKKEQKHRSDVLKKVNYRVASPKNIILKNAQKSPKPLRVSLKGITKSSDPLKPKLVRLSQKIVKRAKSKNRLSPALRLSGKLLTSPKGLKEYAKRKSVLFKSKGIRSKKASVSSRLSSQKRKSAVGMSSLEVANKRIKQSRSANVKASGIKKKSDASVDIKQQSIASDSEKITTKTRNQRKRKISGEKFNSPVAKKRFETINEKKEALVDAKSQSPKKAKSRIQRSKKKTPENLDLIAVTKESNSEAKPVAKNRRKRKAVSDENISTNEQPEKLPKTAENTKNKRTLKTKVSKTRGKSTQAVNEEKSEDASLSEEISEKQPKTVKSSKEKGKLKTKVSKTRGKSTQAVNNEESEDTSLSDEISEKTPKTDESSKNKRKLKTKAPKTRGKSTQAVNNEESENISLSDEVSVHDQTDKKIRTTKRKQKSEIKKDSPKPQRSTRKRQVTEIKDVLNENVEVKANKKAVKRSKITESITDSPLTSLPKKSTRNTKRKNIKTVDNIENEEIALVTLDLKTADKKTERKRKMDKNTPAKIPKVADKKIATENKEKMSTPKDTPKKGRSKAVSKAEKAKKEASPVQRVQRTLRSRK